MDLVELDRQRHARGWTKARLAEEMGVSQPTVGDIYRRGAAPPDTFMKLKAALEGTPASDMALRLMGEPTEAGAA